jgi:septum site-determining protein MinC
MASPQAVSDLDASSAEPGIVPPAIVPPAILRGGARGLEIVIDGRATADAIAAAVTDRLAEAPTFFRGSDVRIRVEDGPLPAGCLSKLDTIAGQFELRIVEVGAAPKRASTLTGDDGVPLANLAAGSAPSAATADPAQVALPLSGAAPSTAPAPVAPSGPVIAPPVHPPIDQLELALAEDLEPDIEVVPDTRVLVGPVRSGVILEHRGHLIIFGDVNPGAEIRAEGNIVVLGRLRGTAHAGINREVGFILALRLEPQQLRIGRMVARASDSDTPAAAPEIAHVTNASIVVERYLGRLPGSLAASI